MFIWEYSQFLKEPGMGEHIRQLQATVLQDYQHFVKTKQVVALKANNLLWQQSSKERQEYNPFSPTNLETTISRVPDYIICVQQSAEKWIGYHFHFPLLWMPTQEYKAHHRLSKKEEAAAWQKIQKVHGFRDLADNTFYNYCLSNLHSKAQYPNSDLE